MNSTFEATDRTDTNPTNRPTRVGRELACPRNRRVNRRRVARPGAAARILTAAVIGLTALSLAFAAPSSAHGSHHGDHAVQHTASSVVHTGHQTPTGAVRSGHQTPTGVVRGQADNANTSTPPASSTHDTAADPVASDPPTAAALVLPGHDKCKSAKGGRPGPPWCTDPAAGWEQSTLYKTDASSPTLSGAKATAAAGRGAVHLTSPQRNHR